MKKLISLFTLCLILSSGQFAGAHEETPAGVIPLGAYFYNVTENCADLAPEAVNNGTSQEILIRKTFTCDEMEYAVVRVVPGELTSTGYVTVVKISDLILY